MPAERHWANHLWDFTAPRPLSANIQRNAHPQVVELAFGRETRQKRRLAVQVGSSSNRLMPGCSLPSRRESFGQQVAEEHCRGKARIKDTLKQGIKQYNKNKSHCSQEKEETYVAVTSSCPAHGWMCSSGSSTSSWVSCEDIAEMYSSKSGLKLDGNLLFNVFFLFFLEYFCIKCIFQKNKTSFRNWVFSLGFVFIFMCLWNQAPLIPCSQLLVNASLCDYTWIRALQSNIIIWLNSWCSHSPEQLWRLQKPE